MDKYVYRYTVHKCKEYSASFGTQLVTLEDPHARELMALKREKHSKLKIEACVIVFSYPFF